MNFDRFSWFLLCVLEWLTKTETMYKSNQESNDQRTLKIMNSVRVHKVSQKVVHMVNKNKPINWWSYQEHSRDMNKSIEKDYDLGLNKQ